MEIDTSRVITDEHRDAIERLGASNLTKEEFEEILQQLPEFVTRLSKEQRERISQLESEGRNEEAVAESVSSAFALKVTEICIYGRIRGRLDGMDSLPDQMAELERIAQFEMGSEIAYIESSLADTFPLPTREVVRLYRSALQNNCELLEKEFNLQRTRKERKEALRTSDLNTEYELTKEGKLLASICPSFRDATPDIKRKVWSRLSGSSRNQWALFLIEVNHKKKDYKSKAEAVNAIIKPKASLIEEINGLTNMRSVVIIEGSKQYAKDKSKINEIISLLNADSVIRKSV